MTPSPSWVTPGPSLWHRVLPSSCLPPPGCIKGPSRGFLVIRGLWGSPRGPLQGLVPLSIEGEVRGVPSSHRGEMAARSVRGETGFNQQPSAGFGVSQPPPWGLASPLRCALEKEASEASGCCCPCCLCFQGGSKV